MIGLATLTWGVIEGPHEGWRSGLILGLFVTAAAAMLMFVLYEPRRRDPLLDLRFFHSVPFSSATLLGVSAFSCFAGFLFLNALYLQQVRGFSAFRTGLFTLPLAIMMVVCVAVVGPAGGAIRIAAFSAGLGRRISSEHAHADRAGPAHLVAGCWRPTLCSAWVLGWSIPAISNSAVAGMPLSQAGVAAAIASTSRQVGAAIGVAVSGTMVAISRARGTDFTTATHAIWWMMQRAVQRCW